MKSLLTLLLFFLLSFSAQAQDTVAVKWAAEQRRGKIYSSVSVGGSTDSSYHIVLQTLRENTLLSFDLDQNLLKSQPLDFSDEKNEYSFGGIYTTNAGSFGVFVELDTRADQLRTHVSTFRQEVFGERRLVYTQDDYEERGPIGEKEIHVRMKGNYMPQVVLSTDKSKVLITKNNRASFGRTESTSIAVLDANFELLWEDQLEFIADGEDMNTICTLVDDEGGVYLLTEYLRTPHAQRRAEKSPNIANHRLYQVTPNGNEFIDIVLGEGRTVKQIELLVSELEKDKVLLAGLYGEDSRKDRSNGIFNLSVNQAFSISNMNVFPFEQAFLESVDKREPEALHENFKVNSYFEFIDGTTGFIAEENYSVMWMSSSGSTSTSSISKTNGLVVVLFTPDYDLLDVQKIEKNYSSPYRSLGSYALAVGKEQITLVYNIMKDTREMERENPEISMLNYEGFVDVTVINKNGEIVRQQPIYSLQEKRKSLMPGWCISTEDYMLLLMMKGNYFQWGLLPLLSEE